MNLDQIRDSIVVKWVEEDGRRTAFATLNMTRCMSADPHVSSSQDTWIESSLKEEIIRDLFEDRRGEIWKAVEAVHMANPYSGDLRDRLNHLFGMIKAMQPK